MTNKARKFEWVISPDIKKINPVLALVAKKNYFSSPILGA
jgi:hypothetical protein